MGKVKRINGNFYLNNKLILPIDNPTYANRWYIPDKDRPIDNCTQFFSLYELGYCTINQE